MSPTRIYSEPIGKTPVGKLAGLLQECPEIGPLFEFGGANILAAEWLYERGVRVTTGEVT